MAVNGEVELTWADGTHKFNIAKVAQILELEDKCGCGIAEVFSRIRDGKWRLNDIRETIRLGLIGAGQEPLKALVLVQRYVDERPLTESVYIALVVIMAALTGVPGDEVGKKEKAETAKETPSRQSTTTTEEFAAPQSTVSEQPSGGLQDRQTN